jgi:hypothetical protein
MITTRAPVVALLVGAAIGCDHSSPTQPPPPPPLPSSAVVSLTTPNADDGAVIVMISGPNLATIQPADSHYVVYSRLASAQEARVIVIGNLVAGPLFTVRFGAPHLISAYSGAVQQVATRGDSILSSTVGYRVTVSAAR